MEKRLGWGAGCEAGVTPTVGFWGAERRGVREARVMEHRVRLSHGGHSI